MTSSQLLSEAELIEKLLTRGHLNVPERSCLPEGKARGSLIKATIANHLLEDDWFPKMWRPDQLGSGAVIERTANGFLVHVSAECSVGRFAPLRVTKHINVLDAAEDWTKSMYGDDIDGVPIDWKA